MLHAIKLFFISIFIFFIGLFFVLSFGINIEKFSFASINVSKLYIKLDKKLIVQIDEITLPATSSTQNSTNDIKNHIKYIPYLLTIFEEINVESLKVKNNEFTISINKSIFYIDNKFINLSAQPSVENRVVTLNLYSLFLKDYNLLLDGVLKANLDTDALLFAGNLFYKELEFDLNAQTNEKTIDFVIKGNKKFQNIRFVKDFITLHPTIEEWMYDNVTGNIHLNYMQGQLNKDTYIPILSSLDGAATIQDAKVAFHQDVEPVHTPLLTVSFKNDNLYFDLEKPTYKDIDIDGSRVIIHALSGTQEPSNIIINLKTKHRLNQDILDILKAYHINLPIIQLDGSTDSSLAIQVYFKNNELHTKGLFKANNSNFSLNGFDFYAHEALVELNDSMVTIKDANVHVDNFFDAKLNLNIDTKTHLAKGEAEIKDFKIKAQKQDLVAIDTVYTDILIDYTRLTEISFPQLFTKISVLKDFTNIDIDNLAFVYDYSQLLKELNINEGNLNINFHNKENIDFRANVKNLDFPIYTKEGKKLTEASIYGQIINDKVIINSLDEKIKIRIDDDKNRITLQDLDIRNEENSLLKEKSNSNLEIKGVNSNVLLNDKQKLLANSYTLLLENNDLELKLTHNSGNFKFIKNSDSQLALEGKNMSDLFMNNFLGIENFFQSGNFNLNAKGTTNLLSGDVKVLNSKIKQLTLINNLITFINTSPAIINPLFAIPTVIGMASNQGFNLAGYRVVTGDLNFSYNIKDELFNINKLNTVGNMADFQAIGVIDLNKKEINSDVTVIFLKDYSKIIGYIPVVNYLFLGDEKNISTQVKISGNLDDPQITTNLTEDAAGASLNFVKRIFNLPVKGIELLTPSKEEQP